MAIIVYLLSKIKKANPKPNYMIPHNDFPLSSLVRKPQIFTKEINSYALDLTFFLRDNFLGLPLIFYSGTIFIETID